ncbi:ornithine cyclodeaminase family protein [Microbacterium sp. 18062]|uniref:ornithine cyclodeaminase family protein n=1 Tax=Microbacterium sp. 18062 TaxID=2681410 RepID=UPI00190F3E52|nr:ornithine cyclodeaminase family protein [Microbacterium sp. 18062]
MTENSSGAAVGGDVVLAQWSASEVESLGTRRAVAALEEVLRQGFDPADDIARTTTPLARGEFLVMPSQSAQWVGLKLITVAPGNGRLGLPRIQGVYTLFDADTLSPRAIIDGAALTALRTPAVSMLALRPLAARAVAPLHVVVIGAGPQARRHASAIDAIAGDAPGIAEISLVSRRPGSPELMNDGLRGVRVVGSDALGGLLPRADVVVCATTAREPIFDGRLIADGALVIAVGSHEPDSRELDSALMARAQILVEDRTTALREAGDVMIPVAEGVLVPDSLVRIADIVTDRVELARRVPIVFKTTGMSWEDLALATALFAARS